MSAPVLHARHVPQLFSRCTDDEGGINIEEAKQRMRKADAVDKETYRAQLKRRKQVRVTMQCR